MNNEQISRRWFEEGWGRRNVEVFKELSPNELDSVTLATGPIIQLEEFLRFYEELITAVPDMALTVERVVPTEDGAAVLWEFTGTHQGEGFGVAASGNSVGCRGTTWHSIRNGQIVSGEDHWDFGSFHQSLLAEPTQT